MPPEDTYANVLGRGLEPHFRVPFSAIFQGVSLGNFHQGRNLWKVAEAKVWSILVNPRTFFMCVLIVFYLPSAGCENPTIKQASHHPHLVVARLFCQTVGMTGDQEMPGAKATKPGQGPSGSCLNSKRVDCDRTSFAAATV